MLVPPYTFVATINAVLMFGYSPKELIGMVMEDLIQPPKRSLHERYRLGFLNSARKREMGYHPPIFAMRKDRSVVQLDIALTSNATTLPQTTPRFVSWCQPCCDLLVAHFATGVNVEGSLGPCARETLPKPARKLNALSLETCQSNLPKPLTTFD